MQLVLDSFSWNPVPDSTYLPGYTTFQHIVNALGAFCLLACVVAAIIGGVSWAFGATSSNVEAAKRGQKTVVGAIVGVVIIGAASILLRTFFSVGQNLQ